MKEQTGTSYTQSLAEQYSKHRKDYATTDTEVFKQLEAVGISGKQILDLGCGDGQHAQRFIDLGAAGVVGIDKSEAMIKLAENNKKSESIHFIVGEAERVPFEAEIFDVVFSNFVVHYLRDPVQVFNEVYRVLRSDGYFVTTFNIFETESDDLQNTEIPLQLGTDVIVINLVKSHKEIQQTLKAAGFKLLSYSEVDSSYLSIADSYKRKDEITGVKNILCVAQKLTLSNQED